jgi:hypothetical protein
MCNKVLAMPSFLSLTNAVIQLNTNSSCESLNSKDKKLALTDSDEAKETWKSPDNREKQQGL